MSEDSLNIERAVNPALQKTNSVRWLNVVGAASASAQLASLRERASLELSSADEGTFE